MTQAPAFDLIERLDREASLTTDSWGAPRHPAQLLRQAAAELARLRADLADAVRVLKPFAEASDACDEPSHPSIMNAWETPQAMAVSIGDFRAASALLSRLKDAKP